MKRLIAQRMAQMDSSGIRKIFDLAQSLRDPIDLSIGQPDFDVPHHVKDAAIDAIRNGFNRYTVTQGIPELHAAIRRFLHSCRGIDPESLLVTSGCSGAIVLSLMVLVDPGDEVLMPDPYFVMYKHLTALMGGVPRFIDTYPDFRLKREKIEPKITSKTKLIIINNPANPTGVQYTPAELKMLAEVAKSHKLVVVSDEVYHPFCYDAPHESFLKYYDRCVLCDGLSKSHAMTGWRLGYAAGPEDIISEMTKLQQYTFVCAPSFAQRAAVRALNTPGYGFQEEYRQKRDFVYEGLRGRFEVVKPAGAFYIFPQAPNGSGAKFVERAIKNGVLIIPGGVFSERDTHFRVSFAAPVERLKRGIEVLNSL